MEGVQKLCMLKVVPNVGFKHVFFFFFLFFFCFFFVFFVFVFVDIIIVWRNFSILGPKLVLAYAEDVLSDSRLKNCAKCKSG